MTVEAASTLVKVRRAFVHAKTKVLDAKAGRIHAVVSTETEDRMGDIIHQDGWDLDNFMKHPVLLANHDYRSVLAQIGEWEEMAVKGKTLQGIARYYVAEGNAEADWAFSLAQKGMAAYSVGFLPDMEKAVVREGGSEWFGPFEFHGQELLEVSHVSIPANAEALQQIKALPGLAPAVREIVDLMIADNDPRIHWQRAFKEVTGRWSN